MPTRSEELLELPLFRGAGRHGVLKLLDRTRYSVKRYHPGDIIIEEGRQCMSVMVVMKGDVSISRHNTADTISISETVGRGITLGAERVFGLMTCYNFTARAEDFVEILEIAKDQYFSLLSSDSVFMLNFINIVSRRYQRFREVLNHFSEGNLLSWLSLIVCSMTERESHDITIGCTIESVCRLTNSSRTSMLAQFSRLKREGLLRGKWERLEICSRERLISEYEKEAGI